jgi:hypothetical protein
MKIEKSFQSKSRHQFVTILNDFVILFLSSLSRDYRKIQSAGIFARNGKPKRAALA